MRERERERGEIEWKRYARADTPAYDYTHTYLLVILEQKAIETTTNTCLTTNTTQRAMEVITQACR